MLIHPHTHPVNRTLWVFGVFLFAVPFSVQTPDYVHNTKSSDWLESIDEFSTTAAQIIVTGTSQIIATAIKL